MDKEPIIHSHITDVLPENHPLAYKTVYCDKCGVMVHCGNNECMQTWLETSWGNYCTKCFPLEEILPSRKFILDFYIREAKKEIK